MIYINILTAFPYSLFMHQLDEDRFRDKIYFAENSDEDIVWDYIVVYENLRPNLSNMKYHKGGLIFISGEPEDSNPYCRRFLNQFDYIISSHRSFKSPKNHLTQQALNWHFGFSHVKMNAKYSYYDLKEMAVPDKVADVSMICSSKTMMPGHIGRYKFYQMLKEHFPDKIDFYGSGIKYIEDKADAILPYRFHICIENSSIDDYWTEKIADAILGYSVPVYFGCTNITNYFPKEAIIIIDIHNPKEAFNAISNILANPVQIYQEKLPYLKEARRQLLENYNIFPMLDGFIKEATESRGEIVCLDCSPWDKMWSWKLNFYYLRFLRLMYKILHQYHFRKS